LPGQGWPPRIGAILFAAVPAASYIIGMIFTRPCFAGRGNPR
jgi:hypothetical protein